jgi:hypothetical protein
MQISPLKEYKKVISDICNIRATIPDNIPQHPRVISPVDISFDGESTSLHYLVSEDGITLREFINFIYSPRNKLRATLFNTLHRVRPIDIILQLIDAYEFMLANDMMVGQSNVNPDCIWIDRTITGELKVYVLNTLETTIDHKYRTIDCNRQYWSSEYIREYNNMILYDSDSIRKPALTRIDTKPTPISLVYSLGLVLYFIIEHRDPYPDGRLYPDERPLFHSHFNERYVKHVKSATEYDPRKRPTLKEWRHSLLEPESKCTIM